MVRPSTGNYKFKSQSHRLDSSHVFFFQVYQRQTLSEETSSLRRMAFARKASFRNSLPRPIYIINSDLIPGGIDAALKFL